MPAPVLLASAAAAAIALYATAYEPFAIRLRRLRLNCPRLPTEFDGFTILQLSDLHMSKMGRRERRVTRMIRDLSPDILAITGDLAFDDVSGRQLAAMALGARPREGCIAVAGPALEKLGLPALHAHMFVFWYALLCTITPPVCGTVFVAAGIAGAPWLEVAFQAMRIGLGLFMIPVGFVVNPALLSLASDPLLAIAAAAKVLAALWLISLALIGCAGSRPPPARAAFSRS